MSFALTNRDQKRALLNAARSHFPLYCTAVFRGYQLARHLELLMEKLAAVEAGTIDRLALSKPPRHGGTLTVSQLYPCWYLGRHPDRNIALCSYNEEVAFDLGRRIQQTMQSAAHQAIFPEAALSRDVGSAGNVELQRGGHVYSVSRNGTLTGRGCDVLICDDLLKDQQEASSATIRKQTHEWYERVGLTRLTPTGAVILVSTRWHEADLTGYLLGQESEKPWSVLNFSAIAEPNDLLGREVGEPLWPERFDRKYLARRRAEMGSRAFVSLYQGRPSEATGNIFKREWWRSYTTVPEFKRTVLTLDSAFKVGKENDYSAWQIWAETQTGFYLLHAAKARLTYPDLKARLLSVAESWRPTWVLVEDAASGQSLVQELQSSTSLPIKAIKVDRDKVSRAESCTPLLECGRVFLPADAPWLNDFLDELSGFPNAQHDDQVDACTMALNFLRGESGGFGLLDFLQNIQTGARHWTGKALKPIATIANWASSGWDWETKTSGEATPAAAEAPGFKAKEWMPAAREQCPVCASTLTVWIASGHLHCNSCGSDAVGDSITTPAPQGACCENPLLAVTGGQTRCQQCGRTWPAGRPMVATGGPNRRDYRKGRGQDEFSNSWRSVKPK
jgi:predicted phage terminase large subunit-like protein